MVKIISVKCQGKKYHVTYQQNEIVEKLVLLEDQIIELRIFKDQTFTDEQFTEVLENAKVSQILHQVLNYVSYQPRSRFEVVRYLALKKVDETTIKTIIYKLEKLKYLDDEAFALSLLDGAVKKEKGPLYLKELLNNKGIDEKIIKEVLAKYPHELINRTLVNLIEKAAKTVSNYPIKKQKALLLAKFMRSGYSMDTVLKAFNEVSWESDHYATMIKDFKQIIKQTNDDNKIMVKMLQKGYQYQEVRDLIRQLKESKNA